MFSAWNWNKNCPTGCRRKERGLGKTRWPANHTGGAVAGFDPNLLMKRKKRFSSVSLLPEADVEALPASGGVGETDMNLVVPQEEKIQDQT